MMAPTAIAVAGFSVLGNHWSFGVLLLVIIWIQISTFCQMSEHTKIEYSDIDDTLHDLMVVSNPTALIVRRIQSSENPAEQNELIAEFGKACLVRGAQRERLRNLPKRSS